MHWDSNKSSAGVPQLKGARWFSYEELKKYTNNFSAANEIGSGGYGKVSFKYIFEVKLLVVSKQDPLFYSGTLSTLLLCFTFSPIKFLVDQLWENYVVITATASQNSGNVYQIMSSNIWLPNY